MGPPAHFLRGYIQHHRRVRYGHLERGAPQDGVWLQPDRPWLPRPRALGQRPRGAESSGHHRGGVSTQRLNRDIQEPVESEKTRSQQRIQTHYFHNLIKRTERTFPTRDGTNFSKQNSSQECYRKCFSRIKCPVRLHESVLIRGGGSRFILLMQSRCHDRRCYSARHLRPLCTYKSVLD